MKKLLNVLVATSGIITALSAYAVPPLANGSWVGIYKVDAGDAACSGSGVATLTQNNAIDDPATSSVSFQGSLTLDKFVTTIGPDYSKPVAASTRIDYSMNSVFINQNSDVICNAFVGMGMYDDSAKTIYAVNNSSSSCSSCHIVISNLIYQPTGLKK